MKRILFIDWLRILAIAAVFLFHSSHFFDPYYWHVKNSEQSQAVLIFLGFLNIWIMPLFFFISGAAGFSGIKKPFGAFLRGKVLRLLVPLVFGILILIPPQKYVEALSHDTFSGTYLEFLRSYFGGRMFEPKMGFNIAWIGMLSYHLWFLGHLFIISVVFYPLMLWMRKHTGVIGDRISKMTSFTGGALLLFIPVAVARVLLKRHFPDYTGWCDILVYSFYFLYGSLYTNHEKLKQSLSGSATVALITGSVLFILYISSYIVKGTFLTGLFQDYNVYGYYAFQEAAGALVTWSWLIVIVSAGMKYMDVESKYRSPLNETVMPFYILHQTVLLLVGFIMVQWNWNPWGKFLLIAGSSLFIIFAIYMLGIRPFNFMRFLFGMKPLPVSPGKNIVNKKAA